MKILKVKKFNAKKLINSICDYGLKLVVVLIFFLLFIGRVSPGWISEKMSPNKSVVKSAFFFKNYVFEIVALDSAAEDSGELENPFGDFDSTDESGSYDDFYANFAAMVAASAEESAEEEAFDYDDDWEDDSEDGLTFGKAEKIKVVKFRDVWGSFKEAHEEIAAAFEKVRTASLFTFFAVLAALLGTFLLYGKRKIRLAGLITAGVCSILIGLSMINFNAAYNNLYSATDFLDVSPVPPHGIKLFVTFAIVVLAFAIALFFTDKVRSEQETIPVEKEGEKASTSLFPILPFEVTFRVLALLLFILLFIPGANPARISENINRNVSLFTSGFSYSTYTENLQRALIRGWLPEYVMRISWISSLFVCLGVIACGAGACMSVGNNKLKRYAHITLLAGSSVSFGSMFGIIRAYNIISSSPLPEKVLPMEPSSAAIYFILTAIIFVCTAITFIKTPAPQKEDKCKIEPPLQLFLMLLPCLILVFLFSYLPLWGWRYAFFDYNPGDTLSMDAWVGFKWFKAPFQNAATRSDILRVLRNTLAMSGLGILGSWIPMFFAIFLSEIRNAPARKIIQTLTTIPNFISWVLVYAIAFCIFGTEGFISSILVNKGIWEQGKNMLMGSSGIWIKMWLYGLWKGLGWSAIMYIAAISGIDQQLYEAATVDGAGRFQKMWHITLPELLPTYIVLLILSISGLLSNGMDQYLCFKNPTNKGPIEVLDLYVYQLTFGSATNSNIPFSTVVSMFKSLVSVILLFVTNKISKLVRGNSIF